MVKPNAAAENVFGILGTVCWTGQLIPQVWKSWRSKSTEGLSEWLMLLWGIAAVFQGVYTVVHEINIPLMIQPQLFGSLCLVSWGQCQYYSHRRSRKTVLLLTFGALVGGGITELALVLGLRQVSNIRTRDIVLTALGILASVLLAVALFPQYWEIYRLQAVVGISLLCMMIDILGGVFFDLSLVYKEEFDVVASVQYSVVVVFDMVILLAAAFFKVKRLVRDRKAGETAQPRWSEVKETVPKVDCMQKDHSSAACFSSAGDAKRPHIEVTEVDIRSP